MLSFVKDGPEIPKEIFMRWKSRQGDAVDAAGTGYRGDDTGRKAAGGDDLAGDGQTVSGGVAETAAVMGD